MTISEIAKLAGVSKACVSRYLNHGYVSEEKKKLIQKVIDETGYVPSHQAQILRTGKSRQIGVILPKINSESIGCMVAGISSVLNNNGFSILLANTENNIEKEFEYLELFQKGQVEGVIFFATMQTPQHRSLLQNYPVPMVVLSQKSEYLSCVYNNDFGAAKEIARLLLETEHKNVGYIGVTQKDRAVGFARRAGFLEAMQEAGLDIPEEHMLTTGFMLEDGNAAAQQLFTRAPETNAVFCATDTLAIGAMQFIKGLGKRIPEDVSIVGIGHSRMTEIVSPRLTTAHLFYETGGAEAAKMLLQILDSGIDMKMQVKLGFEIVRQEST
ncbi:MAG: LacI family DNA-binding transcriptional regulator [Clostridia bacterium]|nr:LacI family DNA-binding transcriptional regulator [Clostridia bacterium]